MLRSRFLWKLYAGYSVLILISTLIVGILISQRIEGDTLEEIRQSLKARAIFLQELASRHLEKSPSEAFQNRVHALGREIDTRLTVIDVDGIVIADSSENPTKMDNHGKRPEVLAARSHGLGTATRFSNTLQVKMMYLALPVRRGGHLAGYVRTSLPLSEIDKRLGDLRTTVILGAGLAAIAALLLGLLVTRHFVNPIISMTTIAESMSCGDYNQRLPTARKDEIGKLAKALNRMAESCRDRMETIITDRSKLSAILSGMAEGVVAVDRDERVLHMNEAAGKLLGASPEGDIDRPIWEVTRVREICEMLSDTLRDKAGGQRELRLVSPSRDQLVEMHAAPLHNGQGGVVGAMVVLHDTSELHRLETVRQDFVANASHELKTPITAIRGLVETLIDDKELSSSKRERFLEKIRDQSMRLSSIVTDLLTLSRLEAEGSELERVAFDLRDTVFASVKVLTSTSEKRGIAVETQVPNTPVEVVGDEEAFGQVVSNLLDNALKYTASGGQVWVRIQCQDDNAIVEVQDTGIGIEPKDRDRIFERFYRVDKARSRELGGTGLGLSIVKHIAITHGGRVTVDSVPGTGSTFRVFLPLAPISP